MTSAGGIVTCQQAGFLGHQKEVMQRLFQSTNLSFSINFTSFPRIHPQNTHFITKYYKLKKKPKVSKGIFKICRHQDLSNQTGVKFPVHIPSLDDFQNKWRVWKPSATGWWYTYPEKYDWLSWAYDIHLMYFQHHLTPFKIPSNII